MKGYEAVNGRFMGVVTPARAARAMVVSCVVFLVLLSGCGDGSNPSAPPGPGVRPVESVQEITGRWNSETMFAQGLPFSFYPIPAFSKTSYNARLAEFSTDLVITGTDGNSGLFSVGASGTAADTIDQQHTVSGSHHFWGSFRIEPEGELTLWLFSESVESQEQAPQYQGTIRLSSDTLILNFTLASPPAKAVGFLPATTMFIARLVRSRE